MSTDAEAYGKTASTGLREDTIWAGLGAEWRQLGGSFRRHGFSFEWHELESAGDVDWGRSFHPGSVEICLNFSGHGVVGVGGAEMEFRSGTSGFYVCGGAGEALVATRRPGERHRFITVELAPEFLQRQVAAYGAWLHGAVQPLVEGRDIRSALGTAQSLTARQQELLASLRNPPVQLEAQVLWYQAKALELVVELLFRPSDERELFCARAKRLASDRVTRVVTILKERLAEPPTLEELGKEVGCSPFYLSRTFSGEVGQTIPQYLRRLRLERAAELLRSGRFNVTEAAMEVGYASLSHFSQAFHEQFGCCPGLYPVSTVPQRLAAKQKKPAVRFREPPGPKL